MDRYRICFPLIGDRIGGSYVATLSLIDRLDRSRFEPVVVLHEDGRFAGELRSRQVPYHLVGLPTYVGSGSGPAGHMAAILRTTPRLLVFLRRHCISLVHTNESPVAETWAVPTRMARRPFIWHEHGISSASGLRSAMQRLASRFICISEFTESQMPRRLRPRCVRIDNPFDTDAQDGDRSRARQTLIAELGLASPCVLVGFFGRLTHQKRPHILIDAAAAIAVRVGAGAQFLIFGDDREGIVSQLTDRARRHGINDAVHFMGWRSDSADCMKACDLVLAPAVDEGFGRVLVEAMLLGTPVVAANSGGHREIVRHGATGLLVPPDDANALAQAALSLLKDRERAAAIAKAARDEALRRYSADEHARRVEAVYDGVLADRSPPRSMHE